MCGGRPGGPGGPRGPRPRRAGQHRPRPGSSGPFPPLPPRAADPLVPPHVHAGGGGGQGWKLMSRSHCQELGQQARWLLIGCSRVNKQSEARSAS